MKSNSKYDYRFNVLLLISCLLLTSCFHRSPPCGPFKNYIYDIDSMAASIYEVADGTDGFNISDGAFTGASILFSDLVMVISADNITYIADSTSPGQNKNWLIKSAYACSPPVPYTDETIVSISITSNNDYKGALPAGTELNELFMVNYHSEFPGVTSPMYSLYPSPKALNEYIAQTPNSVAHLGLRLTEAPSLSLTHIFTITYTHGSGESFVLTTPEVTFQ